MSLLEGLLDNLSSLGTLRWLLESVNADGSLERLDVKGVSGWHKVVVVNSLDECLDGGALSNLLLAHTLGDLLWSLLNTGDNSVWEWVCLGALVVRLDDDNLLTGVSSSNDDGNLARLDELSHYAV